MIEHIDSIVLSGKVKLRVWYFLTIHIEKWCVVSMAPEYAFESICIERHTEVLLSISLMSYLINAKSDVDLNFT